MPDVADSWTDRSMTSAAYSVAVRPSRAHRWTSASQASTDDREAITAISAATAAARIGSHQANPSRNARDHVTGWSVSGQPDQQPLEEQNTSVWIAYQSSFQVQLRHSRACRGNLADSTAATAHDL